MLRISKLADYGTKVALAMVEDPERLYAASELAVATKVSLPMVSKILKQLAKHGILKSQRGSQGGYQFARPVAEISLADIVRILDGEIAMTECEQHMGCCEMESHCNVKDNWSVISQVIYDVLQNITLQQMHQPMLARDIPIKFYK
jgi:FeS assembly SUF system regulator